MALNAASGGPGPTGEGFGRAARASVGVNVVLVCALGVVGALLALALVGTLSYRFSLRADWTREGRYELTPKARGILSGLEREVRIRFVFGRDEDVMRRTLDAAGQPRDEIYWRHYRGMVVDVAGRVQRVLNEWRIASRRVVLEIADADLDPKQVQDWALAAQKKPGELVNRVFMSSGADERVVPLSRVVGVDWGYFDWRPGVPPQMPRLDGRWRVQDELTEALRGLVSGKKTRLYLPAGKRSRVEADGPTFAHARGYLAGLGFEVLPWNLASGPPPDGIVMLAAPGARLESSETQALKTFEARGGRLVLAGDPRQAEDFAAVLEPFGLRLDAAKIDDVQHAAHPSTPDRLRSFRLFSGAHETVAPLVGRALLQLDYCRPVVDLKAHAPGAVREPVLRASSEATATPVDYDPANGTASYVVGAKRPVAGAFLGLACERPVADGAKSRLVVLGSSELFDEQALQAGVNLANRDFLANLLQWLAERPTSAGAPEPDLPGARVEASPQMLSFLAVVGACVLPGALLLVAAFMFVRRRN